MSPFRGGGKRQRSIQLQLLKATSHWAGRIKKVVFTEQTDMHNESKQNAEDDDCSLFSHSTLSSLSSNNSLKIVTEDDEDDLDDHGFDDDDEYDSDKNIHDRNSTVDGDTDYQNSKDDHAKNNMYLQNGIIRGDLFGNGLINRKKLATEMEQNFVCLHCIREAHEQH